MNTVENRFIAIICIIYTVGLLGFIIPSLNPLFLKLTPLNIMGAFVIAWVFHKKWEAKFVMLIITAGILGFFIEYAGVKTGVIFGSYTYGKTLGTGWQGIPYLIGLNWAALVFFTGALVSGRINNPWLGALAAAVLMTVYDFFLEPVAMRYDFWSWKHGIIPIKNYIAWFIISFGMHLLINSNVKPAKNRMAAAMYFIQLGFFILLFVWVKLIGN